MTMLLRSSRNVQRGTNAKLPGPRAPTCPQCRSPMVVATARRGEYAGQRYWSCRRYPTCTGTRPLEVASRSLRATPEETAQQRFDRQIGRRPRIVVGLPRLRRRAERSEADRRAPRYLGGLEEAGFVILHRRRLPGGRGHVDHIVVGPTGVYVIQTRPWTGQVSVEDERLFVDGRLRVDAPEAVHRLAVGVQDALGGELKALGVTVTGVLCFPNIDHPMLRRTVRGILVTGGRGLSRAIRDGDPLLSVRAVDGIALAAHERLDPLAESDL